MLSFIFPLIHAACRAGRPPAFKGLAGLCVSVAAAAGGSLVFAQAPAPPSIHFIWMGGNDCPPCVMWRRTELPKLQASPEFRHMRFSYVNKVIGSAVPPRLFLPDEVEPYKDLLDEASGRRVGSPQAALMVNGVVHYYFLARARRTKLKT